jgi:hypothetical protein
LATLISVSNCCDSMIKVCSAFFCIQNTSNIMLKCDSVSLNCNGDWAFCYCSFELLTTIWLNIMNFWDYNFTLWTYLIALSISSHVWIIFLTFLLFSFRISHCILLKTTITSFRGFITINKLLLWKRE